MREIKKGPPPSYLASYAKETDWGLLKEKATDLRRHLVQEQQGLCAYCMRRIEADPASPSVARIEHIQARSTHPLLTFSWNNLVACCEHGRGKPPKDQSCDLRKANRALAALNVLKPQAIEYKAAGGTIHSALPDVDGDLNELLNLNHGTLTRGRKLALDSLAKELNRRRKAGKKWKEGQLQTFLNALAQQSPAREYLGLIEWYILKKLRIGITPLR